MRTVALALPLCACCCRFTSPFAGGVTSPLDYTSDADGEWGDGLHQVLDGEPVTQQGNHCFDDASDFDVSP